jgi:Protein of unknown function (DUF1552)
MNRIALSRRTALRGLGCMIALPWLEAMTQRSVAAIGSAASAKRTAFVFFPNGVHRPSWFPSMAGALADADGLPASLTPLASHRSRLTVVSGLAHVNAEPMGDGPGDHARSAACFLTGAHPKKTSGSDITNGVSIDQVIAQRLAGRTRFDSLELGLEPGMTAGNCDSGYSCAYSANISWRTPHTPMAKEHDPRVLFERLFAVGPAGESAAARARRLASRKSILDGAREQAQVLHDSLGGNDRRKLDEYLDGIRSIERRIEIVERSDAGATDTELPPKPAGAPAAWDEYARLMADLMVLAFRTDATRVVTLMLGNEGSNRAYPEIGVRAGHHDVSHHGKDEAKVADYAKINRLHAQQFAYLLDRLAEVKDEHGAPLLDSTLVVYGGAIGDGHRHDHRELPIIVAGGAKDDPLAVAHGQYVATQRDRPLCDLFLSVAARMDVALDRFGDSRGSLRLG